MSYDDETLKLVLTRRWFDETWRGDKRIEYRKMSPHWEKLLWNKRDRFTRVRFQRAFTPPIKYATYEILKIDIGTCPIDGWDDQYYRIHFK